LVHDISPEQLNIVGIGLFDGGRRVVSFDGEAQVFKERKQKLYCSIRTVPADNIDPERLNLIMRNPLCWRVNPGTKAGEDYTIKLKTFAPVSSE
ncbi:MAG: hypothetical protein AAF492_18705, partial [Verrucomicrobiota bacterium]